MTNCTTKKGWSEDSLVKALEDLQEKNFSLKVALAKHYIEAYCMYVCMYVYTML